MDHFHDAFVSFIKLASINQSQTSFGWTWGRVNDDRIVWVNYSFKRLIHCLSCSSSFVISGTGCYFWCVFFLSPDHTVHTTSWDQRRASKQQEESEAKGVCLSLHLIPMLLKHSGRHHPAAVWERACLFHPSSSSHCLSLSNQSQTQLTKTGRKMTRRRLNQLETTD